MQYSYTRAGSVLKKAKEEGIKPNLQAQKSYEPHFLVLYLTELSGIFNNYYAKNKIVDKADEYSSYKVALTEAFTIVMKNGLWMLGIKTLEKM